jgi:hypothetical protein
MLVAAIHGNHHYRDPVTTEQRSVITQELIRTICPGGHSRPTVDNTRPEDKDLRRLLNQAAQDGELIGALSRPNVPDTSRVLHPLGGRKRSFSARRSFRSGSSGTRRVVVLLPRSKRRPALSRDRRPCRRRTRRRGGPVRPGCRQPLLHVQDRPARAQGVQARLVDHVRELPGQQPVMAERQHPGQPDPAGQPSSRSDHGDRRRGHPRASPFDADPGKTASLRRFSNGPIRTRLAGPHLVRPQHARRGARPDPAPWT